MSARRLAFLLALAAPCCPAQVADRIGQWTNLPAGPVRAELAISHDLDGRMGASTRAEGTLLGRDRGVFLATSSAWARQDHADLVVRGERTAIRRGEAPWALLVPASAEGDRALASFLSPTAFLAEVPGWPSALAEGPWRGRGESAWRSWVGAIGPERALALLRRFGMVVEEGERAEAAEGTVTFWVAASDGRLRAIELALSARVGRPDSEGGPPAAPWSWESASGSRGEERLQIPIQGSGSGPAVPDLAESRRSPRRRYQLRLAIDPAGSAAQPQPAPEAAALVGW